MANLHRHVCMTESVDVVAAKLRRYVTAAATGEAVVIVLRPHVRFPDLAADVMLRRDVVARIAINGEYRISWTPSDGGAFPRLTGELRLVADEPGQSRLVLTGDMAMQPSALAHRFNQAIARALLVHVAKRIA